jgi:hypothetical protein
MGQKNKKQPNNVSSFLKEAFLGSFSHSKRLKVWRYDSQGNVFPRNVR